MTTQKETRPDEGRAPGHIGQATDTGQSTSFRCQICGFTYDSPIEIEWAAHRCPARSDAYRVLVEVGR